MFSVTWSIKRQELWPHNRMTKVTVEEKINWNRKVNIGTEFLL